MKLAALVNSVLSGNGGEVPAREIYGQQAVLIRSIDRLAENVARLVEKQISMD